VVIAIIAVLMAILIPALTRAREQGKRATCLSNLKQLTLAWIMYADENDDNLVNGNTGDYGEIHQNETPWVLRDWVSGMTVEQKRDAIQNGALWPYLKTLKIYKCPTVGKIAIVHSGAQEEMLRTYSLVDSMNGLNPLNWSNMAEGTIGAKMIKKRMDIPNPAYRIVFLDDGGTITSAMGGWSVYLTVERWWDPPPIRHGDGTTFSFADGHSEYHKWGDPRTIEFGKQVPPRYQSEQQPGNGDIRWAAVAVWGKEAKH
jgi:prepilin-type processing-associated H-X9-DG protein